MEKIGQKGTAMVEHAMYRSSIYGFLAMVYSRELTSDLLSQIQDPRFMGVLSDLGVSLGDEFFSTPRKELLEDLAVEYARLFLGPDKHISPHESVHHERDGGDWGTLWGKSTVEVKLFIESAGLEYKSEFTGIPDHIGVELEFMQKAIERERNAWEEGDGDGALYCLKMEKKFIEEHIARWVPLFCTKIMSHAALPFYREIARVTKDFVEFEEESIKTYISDVHV